jgi:hypothetical protein
VIGLIDIMTVYAPGADGTYTTVLQSDVPCRLAHPSRSAISSAIDRAELARYRELLVGPDYTPPDHSQIDVDGTRWNIVAGTVAALRGPSGAVAFHRADVVRAS